MSRKIGVYLETLGCGLVRATGRIEGASVSYHEGQPSNAMALVLRALADVAGAHRVGDAYDSRYVELNDAAKAALVPGYKAYLKEMPR